MALQDMLKRLKNEIPSKASAPAGDEEGAMEGMEEMDMGAEEAPAASPLADVSEEDIMAELEARGIDVTALREQIATSSEEAPEEMEMGDEMMDEEEDEELA